ncbi:MAG: LuxR C-terminal-related transcriptional regulator [Labedaea sp.]
MAVTHGRDGELAILRESVDGARAGRGAALTLLGEPGIGKTELLDEARGAATGFRVIDICGIDSETEIPLAGLHRLLQPLAAWLPALPLRHNEILTRIGTGAEQRPTGTFALYTAVHRLLAEASHAEPVLCLADDVHWLDRTSLAALAFAARRLDAERVLMLFAAAPDGADLLAGIPVLPLAALDTEAARLVLAEHCPHEIPEDLLDDLLELASGNPLALVELAGALTAEQLAGDATGPDRLPSQSRLRFLLRQRFLRLSADARRLVLLAALDDALDVDTLARAADAAGIDLGALEEARSVGLIRVDGDLVEPPSPLVRSTLSAEAPLAERQAAHRLLVDVLDAEQHPLRWTWHRVALAGEPRSRLADRLDQAAAKARASGDHIGSARAYQRAAELTARPEIKALRLIAAATDASLGGRARYTRALLRQVRPVAVSEELRGLTDLLHGEIELRDGLPALATEILLGAATGLTQTHRTLAVTALLLAADASCLSGNYQHFIVVAGRADELRRSDEPPAIRLMFDHLAGMAATYAGRHAEGVESLRRVVALAETTDHPMARIWASEAAYTLGDAALAQELATRAVGAARRRNLAILLPWAYVYLSLSALLNDRHITAVSSSVEGMRLAGAIGQQNGVIGHLSILALAAALLGDRETTLLRLNTAASEARKRGLGRSSALSTWAVACADLADDRPADALDRLRLMAAGTGYVHPAIRALAAPHFVEAAVRCGEHDKAAHALEIFDHWASTTGSAPRLAQAHRCHGLLAGGGTDADEHFREAIRLHRESNTAFELAKTELFYAHQLRRARKPRAAREHLRDALKIFQSYDAELWADRARAELRAAGETVGSPAPRTAGELTPQQQQIAELVAEGATNREIATQLVVSPRTVEHHLRNIFTKLGVRSRVELAALLR